MKPERICQVFINYRIEDTGPVAKHLAEDLRRVFGETAVFLDHERLEGGEEWPSRLRSAIAGSTVVLALIGRDWLSLQGSYGVRRLDEPNDWVRQELEAAFSEGKVVVPVVVDGAPIPPEAAFAGIPSLRQLASCQAMQLRTRDRQTDITALVRLLELRGLRPEASQRAPVPKPRPFASTIPARGEAPVIGRDAEIGYLGGVLADATRTRFVVIAGQPGVGKSELAFEYCRQFASRYPGGTFQVDMSTAGPPPDLARIGINVLHFSFPSDLTLDDQCKQVLFELSGRQTLLVFDNALDPTHTELWLPPSGSECHVIATSIAKTWTDRWTRLELRPLETPEATVLARTCAGENVAQASLDAIVKEAAGLPAQLTSAARAARRAQERGHLEQSGPSLSKRTTQSFDRPWAVLSSSARLLLAAATFFRPERVVRKTLREVLMEALRWSGRDFDDAFDSVFDLTLLEGVDTVRGNSLLWEFVRSKVADLEPSGWDRVSEVQIRRAVAAAGKVAAEPASSAAAEELLAFRTDFSSWTDPAVPRSVSGTDAHAIGFALVLVGRFEEARLWFERAVAEAERSDVDGAMDHASLGSSVHEVGFCYSSLGRFEEARPWFERAVAEAEQGDVHGLVDHACLGSSLHQVGFCYSSSGQFEKARPWFERAVAEAEQGDVHGLVDHASLGKSVHLVGLCYSSLGRFEEARPWFERAVVETGRGDVHGRVDHASLGKSVHQVGVCYSSLGRFEEARPWFERAVVETERGDVHGRVDHASVGKSVQQVGSCYSSLGRFEEARPWFERAVTESERGDEQGRVDHESLGTSVHLVGSCLSSLGRIEEALPWFERAVAEAERGDVQGRVDHASVGTSVHEVGFCYSSLGQFEEARPWFERAVAEKERGDVHGCVDHASLGKSVHLVGFCYASLGRLDDARPWFERAVAEKERGDVHGRVDHASLGKSVQQVGFCYSSLGRFEEARPWLERAVAEKERGDAHGRVDHVSLGKSAHEVGVCYSSLGRFDEARPWFERAVVEVGLGDVQGRVDHTLMADRLRTLATCLFRLGRKDEAEAAQQRATDFTR